MIPLRRRLAAILGGERPRTTAAIDGRHLRAVDRENVAVRRVTARVAVGILQYLHLHPAMKGLSLRRIRIGPDKDAGIAARLEVPPFDFHNEILVHAQGAKLANRLAGAMNHAVLYGPRVRRAINVAPAVEIFAIEERLELFRGDQRKGAIQRANEKGCDSWHAKVYRAICRPSTIPARKAAGSGSTPRAKA